MLFPPLFPETILFSQATKPTFFFTWNISIFLQIFPKTLIATARSDHLCFAFFRSKVKFSLPFVLSLKLFLIICGFLSHRLSVCLKFAQPIISGTFQKSIFAYSTQIIHRLLSVVIVETDMRIFANLHPNVKKNQYKTNCVTVKY